MDEIEKRKRDFIKNLKSNTNTISYVILSLIIAFGAYIRTRNIPLLKDVVTGKFVPLALDPFVFLRYAQYILEHGSIMANDTLRYFPLGFDPTKEALGVSYASVYLYKFLHFFNSNITIEYAHIIYPVVFFAIGLLFFFLLVKKIFNYKVALVASAFLAVVPGYLYRTMAGFADKEALGMALMFLIFYLFVSAVKEKKLKKSILLGVLAGFFIGIMNASWGGVTSVYLVIGGFVFIATLFERLNRKDLFMITSFLISLLLFSSLLTERFSITLFFTSITSGALLIGYSMLLFNYLLFDKNLLKVKDKLQHLPKSINSLLILGVLGFLGFIAIFGFDFFKDRILFNIYNILFRPFGTNRWALTVAESHQPYVTSWLGQMGWFILLAGLIGSILLFYNLVKNLKKAKHLTALYGAFIFAFIFSRYSQNSTLNGTNSISVFLFIGSLVIFSLGILYFYIKNYIKNKNSFMESLKLNKGYIFVFSWFFFMAMAARGALRLIFIFIPIAVVLTAYLIIEVLNYVKRFNKYKLFIQVATIAVILIFIFIPLAQGTLYQAERTGPSYNQQWQIAMDWVRNNTPEDAVFAHWWDYGYWVQTGGNRATITDGGNFIYAWNHFMGRHVLTGHSEEEALQFLKSHEADYLLMISDEIGKYGAYSSIGADENYDRYSWINTFNLNQNNIQETRNQTILPYVGGVALDDDFVYNDILFPKQQAGIGSFFIPIRQNNNTIEFDQPIAVLVFNGQQYQVPVKCIFFQGQKHEFPKKGLDGCLRIIPIINGNQVNPLGSLLYLSPEVSQTLFTKLFLFNEDSENFELVYNDANNMPLSIYSGVGLIGPLRIWKINYPNNIEKNETYIGKELPDPDVLKV